MPCCLKSHLLEQTPKRTKSTKKEGRGEGRIERKKQKASQFSSQGCVIDGGTIGSLSLLPSYCPVACFFKSASRPKWKRDRIVGGESRRGKKAKFNFTMLTPHHRSQTSAPAVRAPPPPTQNNRSSSYGRPASSIYSQPSPLAATFAAQQLGNEVYADPAEISPPSSPDNFGPPER